MNAAKTWAPLPGAFNPDVAFQQRVLAWLLACFGDGEGAKLDVRAWRFFEEAAELVQSVGTTRADAHRLVDYVYDRPVGEPAQEVGGTMITLAGLCIAARLDMQDAGETELARVWTKIDIIRAKNAAKPMHSPLPQ